jgi:transposase
MAAFAPPPMPSAKNCISRITRGNDRAACSTRTPSERKKRRIRAQIKRLGPHWVKLFEDETDLLLFPPLRAAWGRRGEPVDVPISGRNARRVVFGTLNIETGHRLFLARKRQRSEDFRAFLPVVARHYRGRSVALLLDEDPSHTAQASLALADELGMQLVWLPKRCPELNGMDHLWGHGKDHVCANRQYDDIDAETERFIAYLQDLSNQEALRQAGLLSPDFWLRV